MQKGQVLVELVPFQSPFFFHSACPCKLLMILKFPKVLSNKVTFLIW